ncbi:Zinc finger C2H2-type [Trinorchestia longiramus]|nr:Zinc finger C2H2-type [Trinorchestia longiramus]
MKTSRHKPEEEADTGDHHRSKTAQIGNVWLHAKKPESLANSAFNSEKVLIDFSLRNKALYLGKSYPPADSTDATATLMSIPSSSNQNDGVLAAVPYSMNQCAQQYVLNTDGSVQVLMTLEQYEEQVKASSGSEVVITQNPCQYVSASGFPPSSVCNMGNLSSQPLPISSSSSSSPFSVVTLQTAEASIPDADRTCKSQPLDPSQVLSVAIDRAQVLQSSNLIQDSSTSHVSSQNFVSSAGASNSLQYQSLQLLQNGNLQPGRLPEHVATSVSSLPAPFRYSVTDIPTITSSGQQLMSSSVCLGAVQSNLRNELTPQITFGNDQHLLYTPTNKIVSSKSYHMQASEHQSHNIITSQPNILNGNQPIQKMSLDQCEIYSSGASTSFLNVDSISHLENASIRSGNVYTSSVDPQTIDRYIIQVGKKPSSVTTRPSVELGTDGHIIIRTGNACPKDNQVASILQPILLNNSTSDDINVKKSSVEHMLDGLPIVRALSDAPAPAQRSYGGRNSLSSQDHVMKHVQVNVTQTQALQKPDNGASLDVSQPRSALDFDARVFECPNCNSKFLRSTSLKAHIRSCRKPELKISEKAPLLMCSFCKATFKTKPQICHHLTVCMHSPLRNNESSSAGQQRPKKRVKLSLDAVIEQGIQYRCLDCERTFNKQRQYSSHINRCTQTSVQDMTPHTRAVEPLNPLLSAAVEDAEPLEDPFADPVSVVPAPAPPVAAKRGYPRRRGGRRPPFRHAVVAPVTSSLAAPSSPHLFPESSISAGAAASVVVADASGLVRSNTGLAHTLQLSLDQSSPSHENDIQVTLLPQDNAAVPSTAAGSQQVRSSGDCDGAPLSGNIGGTGKVLPKAIVTNSSGVVSQSRVPEAWSLVCGLCEKLFLTRAALAVHVINLHGPDLRHTRSTLTAPHPLTFRCPVCHLQYSSGDELVEHLVLQHAQHLQSAHAAAVATQKCVVCSVCSLVLATRNMLLEHLALSHMEELSRLAATHTSSHAPIGLTAQPEPLRPSSSDPLTSHDSRKSHEIEQHGTTLIDVRANASGINSPSSSASSNSALSSIRDSVRKSHLPPNMSRNSYVSSDQQSVETRESCTPLSPSLSPPPSVPGSPDVGPGSTATRGVEQTASSGQLGPPTPSTSNDTADPPTPDTPSLGDHSSSSIPTKNDDDIRDSSLRTNGSFDIRRSDQSLSTSSCKNILDHRETSAMLNVPLQEAPFSVQATSSPNCSEGNEDKRCSYMRPAEAGGNVLTGESTSGLECGVCTELQSSQRELVDHYAEQHGVHRDADGCLLDLGLPVDIKVKDTARLFTSPEPRPQCAQLPPKTVLMRPKVCPPSVCKECGVKASELFEHEISSHPERCTDVIRRNFTSLAAFQTYLAAEEARVCARFDLHQASASGSGRVTTATIEYRLCQHYCEPYEDENMPISDKELSIGFVRIRPSNRCLARLQLRVQYNKKTGEPNGETAMSYWPRHSHNIGVERPHRTVGSARLFGAAKPSVNSASEEIQVDDSSNHQFNISSQMKFSREIQAPATIAFALASSTNGSDSNFSTNSCSTYVENAVVASDTQYKILDSVQSGVSDGIYVPASSFQRIGTDRPDAKMAVSNNEQFHMLSSCDSAMGGTHGGAGLLSGGEQSLQMAPVTESYEVQSSQGIMTHGSTDQDHQVLHNMEGDVMEETCQEYVLPADEGEWEKLFHHLARRLQSNSSDLGPLTLEERAEAEQVLQYRGVITQIPMEEQVNVFQKLCILTNTHI